MVASIGAVASPSQGASYYERDGYYAKDDPEHRAASAGARPNSVWKVRLIPTPSRRCSKAPFRTAQVGGSASAVRTERYTTAPGAI